MMSGFVLGKEDFIDLRGVSEHYREMMFNYLCDQGNSFDMWVDANRETTRRFNPEAVILFQRGLITSGNDLSQGRRYLYLPKHSLNDRTAEALKGMLLEVNR